MSAPASSAEAPLCLPPRPLFSLPKQVLPTGTIDTHFHVFKPEAPLVAPRSYTPQILTLTDWLRLADAVGIAKGVVVQPSVYGFDNSVLLDALATAPEQLRGVAVIDAEVAEAQLERLHGLGVRGVRVNTRNKSGLALASAERLAHRIAPLGWVLQFQVHPTQLADVASLLRSLPARVVLDHLGFIPIGTPDTAEFVGDLRRLLDTGKCYVKLSAPYRLTKSTSFDGLASIVTELVGAHADRLLWGSDWPHTELWENVPDDADLIERMLEWVGPNTAQRQVFAANADDLFFGR